MRIALVSDCYPPRLGGIEVQVADLAAQLREAGHDVLVVTATPGPPAAGLLRLSPPLPLGPPVSPGHGGRLRRVLAEADVVHAHLGVLGPLAQQAAGIAAAQSVPTLVTWHSLPGSTPLARALAPSWRRLLAHGVLPTAVSSVAAEQLTSLLRCSPVPVLRNGLDVRAWSTSAARRQASWGSEKGRTAGMAHAEPPHVVSVMRFAARKRPLHLMGLMAQARDLLPASRRFRLTILGDGPWLAPVELLVRSTGLRAWVDLPGRVSRARVAEQLRGSDLYVASSRREAFGIAALEARCVGLPVVGYDRSGVADVVQSGRGGLLVRDDRELVGAVAGLLADAPRMSRYAAYHRQHPPVAHDWPTVAAATLGHYDQARRGGLPREPESEVRDAGTPRSARRLG